MKSKTMNVMAVGKPGSGKSATQIQITRVVLSQSAVDQLKNMYSAEDRERLAKAIRQNCSVKIQLKPGAEGQ